MAKRIKKEAVDYDEVGFADLLKTLLRINQEVKRLRTSILSEHKPAYTNREVLDIFDVTSTTLKSWRDKGLLGYTKVGTIYLYSRDDIDAFLKSNHYDTFPSDQSFVKSIQHIAHRKARDYEVDEDDED